ncbi:replication protein A 32 kDa subunit A-like [Amborella trichopoda]|uniref:replication protein A 32 kDa subunit A-like n=1 Tax=Amborella trichopoda TaxID=13333 RepID=UPI0009BF0E4A|nr:replication protein A 32 kDa subunit A-like [Amborella trichopoda]XP_020523515.1 replication protein A 32 kDa subunit A-like [Amborella trichopoda]|eukprot:XP_020523514.1 replication protein A 32 kDa subunit A-like [Amborella trichopoda]
MSSQFDGSSLFGGGGFMPFESTQSTQHSPSSSRGRGVSALLPCTVKQLSRIFAGDSSSIGIDAIESDTIRLVGMVVKKDERVTDVQFALDDGTGKIDVHRWINDAAVKRWKWCRMENISVSFVNLKVFKLKGMRKLYLSGLLQTSTKLHATSWSAVMYICTTLGIWVGLLSRKQAQ